MEQETMQKLGAISTDVLEEVLEWVRSTKDFVVEQTPLVINEVINWGIYKSGLMMLFGFVGIITIVIVCTKSFKWFPNKYDDDWSSGVIITWLLGIFFGVICVPIFFSGVYNLLYILIAPRLYVIGVLQNMIS